METHLLSEPCKFRADTLAGSRVQSNSLCGTQWVVGVIGQRKLSLP